MVRKKRESKRVGLKQKYRIIKRVKEHDRKERREARKNPSARKKLSKDPGIPNLNPYKEAILKRMQMTKKILEHSEKQSMKRAAEIARRRKLNPMAELEAEARRRREEFLQIAAEKRPVVTEAKKAGEQTRRAFYKHLREVVAKSDIILEVLDVRDPLACRAALVERMVTSSIPAKKLILVLNKVDLVPPEIATQWDAYLRREFPVVLFKASTQTQRSHLAARTGAAVGKAIRSGEVTTGAGAAGVEGIMGLIKNYAEHGGMKRAVTVGIVGYPNVGKSSLINSLTRKKAVGVSPKPGFTRVAQEIQLDKKVVLVDCPGVIFDDSEHAEDGGAGLLLRNCISVESMDDPQGAVSGILKRCSHVKLMAHYAIPSFSTPDEFLYNVAMKRGKLLRGGVPDLSAAARSVLQDWNAGAVPFFTLPPADSEDAHVSAELITSDGASFPGFVSMQAPAWNPDASVPDDITGPGADLPDDDESVDDDGSDESDMAGVAAPGEGDASGGFTAEFRRAAKIRARAGDMDGVSGGGGGGGGGGGSSEEDSEDDAPRERAPVFTPEEAAANPMLGRDAKRAERQRRRDKRKQKRGSEAFDFDADFYS